MKKSRIIFMSLIIMAAVVSCSKSGTESFTQLISPSGNVALIAANPGGNVTCEEVAAATGCTFESTSGRIDYDGGTGGTYGPITWTTDGVYVNWTSTVPVKIAIIVKGGNGASVYSSGCNTDCVTSGTALSAPINPNNGKPYGLSNITFCYTECEEPELVLALKTIMTEGYWASNSDGPDNIEHVPFVTNVTYVLYRWAESANPVGTLVVGNFDADALLEVKITATSTLEFLESYLFVGLEGDFNDDFTSYPYQVISNPSATEVIFDLPF